MIGQTISHYKIIEELGSGGMGTVYKARDTRLDRFVALKFLPPHLSQAEDEKRRFIHEAKAASALDHPNICSIYEIDETADGQMFIVMACYEGESLKLKIERGLLPVEEALDIAIQITRGLEKAHGRDIIHRDIKPANIMITEDGVVKIVDFGLAKLAGQTKITKTGSTLGTVSYMSPEQIQGKSVDQRTDIWALGVVVYEMLTGNPPFTGEYEPAVTYSIMNEEPKPITELCPDIPQSLVQIVSKALEKGADKRYQLIKELLDDLESLSVGIVPDDIRERIRKAKRRKIKQIILYGVAAILLITVVTVMIWTARQAHSLDSIAVLPLKNLTGYAEKEYFVDGMTDELIGRLGQLSGLRRVSSRTSIMQYKETQKSLSDIARELKVDAIIEGAVYQVGDSIRGRFQLINVLPEEQNLWGRTYQLPISEVLAMYSEVARAVAGKIKVDRTQAEETHPASARKVNPKAYDACLKGYFYWFKLTPQDLETALKYFELATELDPDFALGYAGIASVWSGRAQNGYISYDVASAMAKPAAAKALELDSNLAEVQYIMGILYAWLEWNWDKSVTAFEKAIKLNPSLAEARAYYSHVLFFLNHPEEGMEQIELALELDPFHPRFQVLYAMDLMYVRRYDDAIEALEKIHHTNPHDQGVLSMLKSAYHQKQMYQEAIEIWRYSFEINNDHEAIQVLNRGNDEGGYSVALQRVAELMIERSKIKYVTPWQIATLYTRAGMNDKAIIWFEKAYVAHDNNMPYLSVDPIFDGLRDDLRFKNLIKRMGLKS